MPTAKLEDFEKGPSCLQSAPEYVPTGSNNLLSTKLKRIFETEIGWRFKKDKGRNQLETFVFLFNNVFLFL